MSLVKKIRIDENSISANSAYDLYNKDLNLTIESEFDRAILILHKNIPADHFLWEWALDWKSKFLENGKLLSILTSDQAQNDALNGLHLKSTVDPKSNSVRHDLEKLYSDLNSKEDNPADLQSTLRAIDHISQNTNCISDNIATKYNTRIQITGEYSCGGCGANEVFLKGEIAPPCSNSDCIGLSDEWHLKIELF